MGRTAQNRSSDTRAASSITIRDTPLKPLTVCSLLGSDTMREPLASSRANPVWTSTGRGCPSALEKKIIFLNSSEDRRSEGDKTSTNVAAKLISW